MVYLNHKYLSSFHIFFFEIKSKNYVIWVIDVGLWIFYIIMCDIEEWKFWKKYYVNYYGMIYTPHGWSEGYPYSDRYFEFFSLFLGDQRDKFFFQIFSSEKIAQKNFCSPKFFELWCYKIYHAKPAEKKFLKLLKC